jgi:predicted DCC family thiol-disulfide oxidoreductase YuxK
MLETEKITIFYDSTCGLCRATAGHFSKLRSDKEVVWQGVSAESDKERRELRFRVIDQHGKEHLDTDARLLLLKIYPRYRLLASLLSLRILRVIIDPIFSLIATNRHRISGALGCSDGNGCGLEDDK